MRNKKVLRLAAILAAGTMMLTSGYTSYAAEGEEPIAIADQGIFSAGGITLTSEGTFDPSNQWEETGAGQTAHVDHAMCSIRSLKRRPGCPWYFSTATDSRVWDG